MTSAVPYAGAASTPADPLLAANAAAEAARRRAVAVTITFVTAVLALWAILGYVGNLSDTLNRISALNGRLKAQMAASNEGLAQLERKTSKVAPLASDSGKLAGSLGTINSDLAGMGDGAGSISSNMVLIEQKLAGLGGSIDSVAAANDSVAGKLEGLDASLSGQKQQVGKLKASVGASRSELGKLPASVSTTNARLGWINGTVCHMGKVGVQNQLALRMLFLGIPTGQATIFATMIPPGGWRCP